MKIIIFKDYIYTHICPHIGQTYATSFVVLAPPEDAASTTSSLSNDNLSGYRSRSADPLPVEDLERPLPAKKAVCLDEADDDDAGTVLELCILSIEAASGFLRPPPVELLILLRTERSKGDS